MKSLLRLLLVFALVMLGAAVGSPAASGQDTSSSAVTVSGSGEFANLKVTVGQTADLLNQVVKVSWEGATPPVDPSFDFLQIMQCWGGPEGPVAEQCQFGTELAADQSVSRNIGAGSPIDPKEREVDRSAESSYIPFWPAGGSKPTDLVRINDVLSSPYLDAQITNELGRAYTRPDGSGEYLMEVQTARQNAGFNCGQPVVGSSTGESCWLVVVPRGRSEVDGSTGRPLVSSPLSRSNFDKRIQIRLNFLPIERACTAGRAERPIRGHETAVEAVTRWQPSLCAGGGPLFSYTQQPDDIARNDLVSGVPSALNVVTNALPVERTSPQRPLVYAPIALSGLAIGLNVVRQPQGVLKETNGGSRFAEVNLTPRLVAKLLTQSYRTATIPPTGNPPDPLYLQGNPEALTRDPEFLQHNPEFKQRDSENRPADAIVSFGTSDVTGLLWTWILADADARAFLSGTPDEAGMVVNPANKGIVEAPRSFPRNDAGCTTAALTPITLNGKELPTSVEFCTADYRQVANDMHDAARAASRGLTLERSVDSARDPNTGFVKYRSAARQNVRTRSVLAVVDTATADRFGLQTARLAQASPEQNPVRQFVGPNDESLLAGFEAMTPGPVPGVLQPNVAPADPAAYPLTSLSYAVTAPATFTADVGADYASFLEYAAGRGQTPGLASGTLPFGYAPLPGSLREQTLAAAIAVRTQAGVPAGGLPSPTPVPSNPAARASPAESTAGAAGAAGTNGSGSPAAGGASSPTAGPTASGGAALAQPGSAGAAGTAAALSPLDEAADGSPIAQAVAAVRSTPGLPAPAVGALLVALLICGAAAAAAAPVVHHFGSARSPRPVGPDPARPPVLPLRRLES